MDVSLGHSKDLYLASLTSYCPDSHCSKGCWLGSKQVSVLAKFDIITVLVASVQRDVDWGYSKDMYIILS